MSGLWRVLVWLSIGTAAVSSLYWWLLNVPESSLWTVGLSALLVLATLEAAVLTLVGGALLWLPDVPAWQALRRGLASTPAFVLAVTLFVVIWWITVEADQWLVRHAGEIDATFMSRFGWTRTAWLHRAIAIILYVVRAIVGPTMALALVVFAARGGARQLARAGWFRAALSRRVLSAIAIFEVALVLLPLQAVYWRPRRLPPTSIEGMFVAFKLGLIFLLVNVGIALMLRTLVAAAPARGE